MITIAIVEDDKKSAKILQDYILRYSEEKQEPLAVECFENGLNFISDYKASCDIALMDIEMPHMNVLTPPENCGNLIARFLLFLLPIWRNMPLTDMKCRLLILW